MDTHTLPPLHNLTPQGSLLGVSERADTVIYHRRASLCVHRVPAQRNQSLMFTGDVAFMEPHAEWATQNTEKGRIPLTCLRKSLCIHPMAARAGEIKAGEHL